MPSFDKNAGFAVHSPNYCASSRQSVLEPFSRAAGELSHVTGRSIGAAGTRNSYSLFSGKQSVDSVLSSICLDLSR